MLVNFLATETLTKGSKSEFQFDKAALDRVGVIILGGGEGKRLAPLTHSRCKPAISFGGRYTLIDIPISHALTSGLTKIFIIGQYLAYTLQKHLFQTYLHDGIAQNQLQLLVPEEREGKHVWFKGTADAIRQNLYHLQDVSVDYFLILSGDQLYNINFQEMIRFGMETNASMVIATQPVSEKDAKRMGLLKLQQGSTKVVDFVEKPQEQSVLDQYAADERTLHELGFDKGGNKRHLGSMGIYLFKRQALFELLHQDPREDFGKHLIKTQMKKGDVHAFLYEGYWEDIGTIESYYHANLALTLPEKDKKQGLLCYDENHIIMTKVYRLPGAKFMNAIIQNSLVCEGSIIEAREISHSILGVRTVVGKGTIIRDSIIMGNEYYERKSLLSGEAVDRPSIGENCVIQKAIIDENVKIGKGVKLLNQANHINYDSPSGEPSVCVRDGIIVIPRGTHLPNGFVF